MIFNWKNGSLKPNSLIKDALNVINNELSRTVVVVDDNQRLLGTITDGDIRRGLMTDLSLNSPLTKIMNRNPITANFKISRKEALEIIEQHNLLALPLMDNEIIVGIELKQMHTDSPILENPVFLMAGGFGKRLHPLTNECPKPMLKICEKPLLEILLESFTRLGFKNFYISTHFMPDMITEYFGNGSKWNVNISYIHELEPLGTGGALGLLPKDIARLPLIVSNGDVLTNINFLRILEFHNKAKADVTMCVRDYEYQVPFGVVNGDGNKIISMVEKPIHQFFVNAGIYILNPSVIDSVSSNTRIDMPKVIENQIIKNKNVMMFPICEYWLDIGHLDDYNRAQIDFKNLVF